MSLRAVWRRGPDEIGRRELTVPFEEGRIVEGDVVIEACCTPSDDAHQCVSSSCEELRSTGFLDDLTEPVDCEP